MSAKYNWSRITPQKQGIPEIIIKHPPESELRERQALTLGTPHSDVT
jgi:hypothetical protein